MNFASRWNLSAFKGGVKLFGVSFSDMSMNTHVTYIRWKLIKLCAKTKPRSYANSSTIVRKRFVLLNLDNTIHPASYEQKLTVQILYIIVFYCVNDNYSFLILSLINRILFIYFIYYNSAFNFSNKLRLSQYYEKSSS